MRAATLRMLVVTWTLVAIAPLKGDEPAIQWLRNLEDAKRIAQTEKKDLLINFTGLTWCVYCKRLEAEVFSQPEFAAAAQDFVLVEIDYPGTDERLEGDMKEWFPKLRDYYMVAGYPTVVIADSDGLPVAYTGYDFGITPAKFLKELARDRAGRQARDEAQADAAKLTGGARAKKLDEALKGGESEPGLDVFQKSRPAICLLRQRSG
jgi:thioredoxin-related protein